MAKETKEKTTSVEITPDNVAEEVRKGNLIGKEHVDAALAEIQKETDEKKKREAKTAILSSQYNRMKSLYELRKRRREEKITLAALKKREEFMNDLLAGKMTPTEYEKAKDDHNNEVQKQLNESSKQFDMEIVELRESYAGEYRWNW